jgi:hypothetical protein
MLVGMWSGFMSRLTVATCAVMVWALAGCASNTENAAYQQSLTRAQASLQQAEAAGAYEVGSAELNSARDKLAAARDAAEEGEEELANRLATEAELDAELASAMARNQEMQSAVGELEASIEALREEVNRAPVGSGSPQSSSGQPSQSIPGQRQ